MTPTIILISICAILGGGIAFFKLMKKYDIPTTQSTSEPDQSNAQSQETPLTTTTGNPPSTPPTNTGADKVYKTALAYLEKHLTLNDTVPEEVGCAEAVSFVLRAAGYEMPTLGIPSVNGLIDWMTANSFEESKVYGTGYVITAHNPDRTKSDYAHIGICGERWIMSNTSYNAPAGLVKGKWQANYSPAKWIAYFGSQGSQTRYFKPV